MPNPLASIIEIDDRDKEFIRMKHKISEMEELMWNAHRDRNDPEKVHHWLEPKYLLDGEFDKSIDDYVNVLILELAGQHGGDCTAFPAGCGKCLVEDYLGITTVPFSKGVGHAIDYAFRYGKTVKNSMRILKEWDNPYAYEYMEKYLKEHGFDKTLL